MFSLCEGKWSTGQHPVFEEPLLKVRYVHHDLETVEKLGLGTLNLGTESFDQVLIDNTVRLQS